MPEVAYLLPDGTERVVDVAAGLSVMDGSVRNNLPGIVAECGGTCSCATCHVWLDQACWAEFDEATEEELELLEFLDGRQDNSRLACQLIMTNAHNGIRVTVPADN